MKKNKLFSVVVLLASLGIVFFIGLHFFGVGRWEHGNLGGAWQNKATQMQAFHQGNSGKMGGQMMQQGREFHRDGMMMGDPRGEKHFHGEHGFALGGIIFAIGAILLGWLFRKNAGESLWRKWLGWVLIGIGSLALFARVLPLVVLAVIIFALYKFVKGKKQGRSVERNWKMDEVFESVSPISTSTGTMLDEWERNITKEEE